MTTNYPGAIDGYSQIRIVRDGIDEIIAGDHNDLRSAVVAIEQTLGINPQGAFGSVTARLNDAYANIEQHAAGNAPRHTDSQIDSPARSGAVYSLADGTVSSQIVELLGNLNSVKSTTTTLETAVADLESSVSNASIARAFDGFVMEGMAVTQYAGGPNAAVASGRVTVGGTYATYSGGHITVSSTPGTYYIYARISGGSLTLGAATLASLPLDPENSIVLLHKITHSGTTWSSDSTETADIRRFGMFVNNKNCFTVGNTPSAGADGYGCDFTSLRGAVEYVRVLNTSTKSLSTKKIMLSSDIEVQTADANILLDIEGMEIDGAGHKITLSDDEPIFLVEADDICIKNLVLEGTMGSPSDGCLARVGYSSTVDGTRIADCVGSGLPYFLRCGDASGTTAMNTAVISNNNIEVLTGGIEYVSSTKYHQSINSSIIEGNRFSQGTSFSATSYSAIRVSMDCVVTNNVIQGGFDTGILIGKGERGVISNNVIIGYSSSALMNNGISAWTDDTDDDTGIIISNNIIRGVVNYGIDCAAGTADGQYFIVSNNLIDNYETDRPATMVGIRGTASNEQTWIVGNKITAPGAYGITDAFYTINNQILGHTSVTTTTAAINNVTGLIGNMACNNHIYNCAGVGIALQGADKCIVTSNLITSSNSGATTAITSTGTETAIIEGNIIKDYASCISMVSGQNLTVSNNRLIDFSTNGIVFDASDECIVIGNWIVGAGGNSGTAISGFDAGSIIANNHISYIGQGGGGYFAIIPESSSADNVVISNNAFNNIRWGGIMGCTESVISGNSFYNVFDTSIDCDGAAELLIANNVFMGVGNSVAAIADIGNRSSINGNLISLYGTGDGDETIRAGSSKTYCSITNNTIIECRGAGIDCNNGSFFLVANNYLHGNGSNSGDGIINVEEYSSIVGNVIGYYGNLTSNNAIETAAGAGKTVIANNYIHHPGSGMDTVISLGVETYYFVVGNSLLDVPKVGIDCGVSSWSVIANNFIKGVSSGTTDMNAILGVGNANLIQGNYIINPNYNGIVVDGSSVYCAVNYIYNANNYGIHIRYATCDNSSIIGNYITTGNRGIQVDGADHIVIHDNNIYPTGNGMEFNSVEYLSLHNNYIYNAGANGIVFIDCLFVSACSNFIYNSGDHGMALSSTGNDWVVSNNYIGSAGDSAIHATSGTFFRMRFSGNYIHDPADVGILLTAGNAVINDNIIYHSGLSGMQLSGNGQTIVGNCIHSPGISGIEVTSGGTDSVISNNHITYAYFGYGIRLNANAHRSNICGNIIRTALHGIETLGCDDCVLSSNLAYDVTNKSFSVAGGDDCIVIGNRSVSSGSTPLDCSVSYGTLIIGNWFDTSTIINGANYLVIGNLCEGGTPAGWSGPPAGVIVSGTNYETYA